MMMVHARAMIVMLLQAHPLHQVQNDNVVDHVDSYGELVSRFASMTMSLENEKAKTMKLEKEKLISKEFM